MRRLSPTARPEIAGLPPGLGRNPPQPGGGRVYAIAFDMDRTALQAACHGDLARPFAWFGPCVSDVRMLRMDETNDLRPVMDAALPAGGA